MYINQLFPEDVPGQPKLAEVSMNPSAFNQSLKDPRAEKVKVGFEFEVCVKQKNIRAVETGSDPEKTHTLADVLRTLDEDWCDYVSLRDLPDIFSLKAPITIADKTYTTLKELVNDWSSSTVTIDDIYKTIEKSNISSAKKTRMITYLQSHRKSEIEDVICELRSMVGAYTNSSPEYELNEKLKTLGILSDDLPTFFLDVFGTKKNKDIFTLLDWDWDELNEYGIVQVDYDYDYGGAVNLLRPLLKTHFGKVEVFSEYHQHSKNYASGAWYIEPDGSLHPEKEDGAAEVVTPPMLIPQALESLKTFFSIAKANGIYTNASTGLHMNVSIPDKIDVLKLAIFLGDEYLLKLFNREDSEYAQAVLRNVGSDDYDYNYDEKKTWETPKKRAEKLIKILSSAAKDASDDHMASVSFERGNKYISFRHVGGDYLKDPQAILNVLGRVVRAMVIASDPNAFRQEYLSKLVKRFGPPANINKNTFEYLNKIRTTAIPVVYIVACPAKPMSRNTLINKALDEYGYRIRDIELRTALTYTNPAETKALLVTNAPKHLFIDDDTDTDAKLYKGLLQNVRNSVTIVFPYEGAILNTVSFNEFYNNIYSKSIGVSMKYKTTVAPGSPLHQRFLVGILANAKEEMLRKKRENEYENF